MSPATGNRPADKCRQYFDNQVLSEEIAALLHDGHKVTITVKGRSMSPFLRDGRDSVELCQCRPDALKPGDVVLARENRYGRMVLHRIVMRDGNRLTLQGDGNPLTTEESSVDNVAGIATAFIRKSRTYKVTGTVWRTYSRCWKKLLPIRKILGKLHGALLYMRTAVKGHKRAIALSMLTGILSVALSLLFIYLSKQLIDIASGKLPGELAEYAIALASVVVLQLACDAVDGWIGVKVQIDAGNDLRHRLFSRLLRSRWNELEHFHTGDVVNRVERDTSAVVRLLTVTIPAFFITAIQLMAAFAFFCYLDAWLPWIVAGILPFFLIGSRFYMRRMYRYSHEIRATDSRIQSIIQESLQQRTVIKALEQDRDRVDKLAGQQNEFRSGFMRRTRFSLSARTCVSAAFAAGYLVAFFWGLGSLAAGIITFGTMAAFLQLVGKVQGPLLDISRMLPLFAESLTSIDRLRELESVPAEPQESPIRFEHTPDIEISDVTFRYSRGDKPVFQNFSCRIAACSKTAVTGETGRGKTTLVRMLLALASPQSGTVELRADGKSASVSPATRCNFTYIPQGNTIFSGTVRDNLLMGNPRASDTEMRRALRTAAADFVFALPKGLDSFIGEQGGGLSEGQAQRIAIARALLRDSHILLLDEATSALDDETERRLMDNLETEYTGKTFIFITHHAAVRDRCDNVISL